MDKQIHGPNQRVLLELLREVRQDRGLRQADVAERLDAPQSFVSKYERGERRLDVLELREVCRALGVGLAEFAATLEGRLGRPPKAAKRRPRG